MFHLTYLYFYATMSLRTNEYPSLTRKEDNYEKENFI